MASDGNRRKKRANPPICWLCDRRLAQGGYAYTVIVEHGIEHPAHVDCARSPGLAKMKTCGSRPRGAGGGKVDGETD